MLDDKSPTPAKRGLAAMSKEKQAEARAKSLETRKNNAANKSKRLEQATDKRKQADALVEQAEMLRQEADELDGEALSLKNKKKRDAELVAEIDARFRDSVSPQYLKTMKQHAIIRNLSADELVTPSHAAMDILQDPEASNADRKDAMKMLQQFENAKPVAKQDELEAGQIGTAQEEMDNLMKTLGEVSPKR